MHLYFGNIKLLLLIVSMTLGISLSAQEISLEISDISIDENGGEATVTATSDDIFSSDTEVVLSFSGTATIGEDYTASDTNIIIPEGSLDGSITLTSIDDDIFEGDETIIIDIESIDNGTTGSPSQVTTTIIDAESPPEVTLSVSSSSIGEGENTTLTANLTTATSEEVEVTLDTINISTSQDDYTLSSETITIEAGETSGTATLTATDDDIYEEDEEVEVSISQVEGGDATFEEPQAVTITITENQAQPQVTLSAEPLSIEEGGSSTLTATLSSETFEEVTVSLDTNNISTSQDDYTLSSETITIEAGETSGTATLTATDDGIYEENEEVEVSISQVEGGDASLEEPDSVTITIEDEQAQPQVTLSADPLSIEEGNASTLTASLSTATFEDVEVSLDTNNISTNQDDYDLSSNTITIEAGETSGNATLTATDDDIYEENEEVGVSISEVSGGDASLEEPDSVTITIEDEQEQPQVTLSADPLSIEEGNASTLTASLSTATFEDVEVSLDTNNISTNQDDYELSSNTITIEAGETSGTATLTATDDAIYEENEEVGVSISQVEGGDASLEEPDSVTITIEDEQEQPQVTLSADPLSIEEGGSSTLTATLSSETFEEVTVSLDTNNISTSQDDYDLSSNTITIEAGETSGTATLTATDDGIYEEDEEVEVSISEVSGGDATLEEPQSVTITITENQAQPQVTLSANPLSIEEGNASTLTASLSTATFEDVEVSLDTNNISTNQDDYELSSNTITIEAGETSGTATLTATDDDIYEEDEEVEVSISEVSGGDATLEEPQSVTITITENQAQPQVTLSAEPLSIEEGGSSTLTATLSSETFEEVTVSLDTNDISTSQDDYDLSSNTITIEAGETSGTATLTATDDDIYEGEEEVEVSISDVEGGDATYDDNASVTITIEDAQEQPSVYLQLTGSPFSEDGGTAAVNVLLSHPSAQEIRADLSYEGTASEEDYSGASSSVNFPAGSTQETILLTGEDNLEADGDRTIIISISSATNATIGDDNSVTATLLDDDIAGITPIISDAGTTTSETGTQDAFELVLNTQPASDVVLEISGLDPSEGQLSTQELNFTSENWDQPQVVTITGVDDDEVDGDIQYTLTIAAIDDQSDNAYHGLSTTVDVINTDNDNAALIVAPENESLQTSENETSDDFTIELSARPTSNVVINVTGLDTTEGTLNTDEITFTPYNWDEPQTVTVTGVNDDLEDGDISYTLTLTVVENQSDEIFHGLSASVEVVNADNDNAELIVAPENENLQTSEDGASDHFTIELNNQPKSNVVINITGLDETEGSLNADYITFTPDNWDQPRTLTVTGVNDNLVDGDIAYTLNPTVVEDISDENFHGLSASVGVVNADNDQAALIVDPDNESLQTSENGSSDRFTIELSGQPTSDVVINITGLDETEGSLNTDEITFTPDNWNEPKTVTVTGVDDNQEDGDVSYTLTLTVGEERSDEPFHGLSITIDVLNAESDTEEQDNQPPSATDDEFEVDQNTTLNGSSLLSNDSDPDGDTLSINTMPVNQPTNGKLVINEDGTFTYTPNNNFFGTDSFTYEVCDSSTPPACDTAMVSIDVKEATTGHEVRDGFSPEHGNYIIPWLDQYDKVSLVVFNRWGKVVYSQDKYENNWNGQSNKGFKIGNKLPVGTYYYVITIADNNKKLSGYIYLTR